MEQTYNVKLSYAKKAQLKLKLNSIRKRTKVLLEKHNWRKFFGSSNDEDFMTKNENNFNAQEWNVTRNIELVQQQQEEEEEEVEEDEILVEEEHDDYDELSSTLIDYYYYSCYYYLNNEEQQPQKALESKKKFEAVNTQERRMNEFQVCVGEDVSFCNTVPHNFKTPVSVRTQKNKRRHQDLDDCSLKSQASLTFIGELVSTSTPTSKRYEPITSTPNVSTHNPLNYHPTYTIRNKKMKKSLQTRSNRMRCACKSCHTCVCHQKQRLSKKLKSHNQHNQVATKLTNHVQLSIHDLLYIPRTEPTNNYYHSSDKIYYL